ncbi:hypothetical protein [Polaribacter sp.]|uniref:hypothetical protein n=1 Tax=Polaribacter sp. TaxID=1920175 RepID=UPI0025CF4C05|nr:hypothetical protein [Polaribacter sp.]
MTTVKKENQDLKKYIKKDYTTIKNLRLQIIELEKLIDFKDKKYWRYVYTAEENIKRLENMIVENKNNNKGGA